MNKVFLRNVGISIFVVLWLCVFHYESLRAFYLNSLFKRELPKVKFLFPPAGWIMFYNVDERFSAVEVYGVKDGQPQLIDPHRILQMRPIGYDNIHRGAMFAFISMRAQSQACAYLQRKFGYFEKFFVAYVEYPSVTTHPLKEMRQIVYQCEK